MSALVKLAEPDYSRETRRQQGFVAVSFALDGSGTARAARVVESTLSERINHAVLDALARSQFREGVSAENCSLVVEMKTVLRQ
jgi:TonB family protein